MVMKMLLATGVLIGVFLRGNAEIRSYESLCTNIIAALGNETLLISPGFTNQMHSYLSETNAEKRSMAELALSISQFSMFEKSLHNQAYDASCRFCSNVIYSADLPVRSWQKSVACVLYAGNLAMDGKYERARSVCDAGLSVHLSSPTTDVERMVWAAIATHDLVPDISITNALKLCAGLSLAVAGESAELYAYTNGLPPQAIQILSK
ncbi:MAG: hypothetical protein ACI4RD_08080 [Kiritimatiellia bacterium]